MRALCGDAAWLATLTAPLARWARIFATLVDAYLAARGDDAAGDFERVRSTLAGLARLDLDGRAIGFREAREHAIRQLRSARADRGEPLAAGVAIVPLAPMRAVPFRVAFVVGLDERMFPASDQPSSLDLRRPRDGAAPGGGRGELTPRDRDRHAFFEAVLGARDALYVSYVAVEPKSGQPIGPSSVVLELADALAPYLGATTTSDALARLARRAPLHRFAAIADPERRELPPAIARERWAAHTRDAIRGHLRARALPVPDEDGMLALLADPALHELRDALGLAAPPPPPPTAVTPARALSIAGLRKFLEAPIQAWARVVLDLDDLPDEEVIERSDEPYHVNNSERANVLREVLRAQLADPATPAASIYAAIVRDRELRGQFPVGVFGSAQRVLDVAMLDAWRAALPPCAPEDVTRIAFGGASSAGAHLVPALELALPGARTVRLVGQTELMLRDGDRHVSVIPMLRAIATRSPYHVRAAVDHAVLAAAGLAPHGHRHILLDPDGKAVHVEHEPWPTADARRFLAELAAELFDQPHGYLLPFDGLARALCGVKPTARYADSTDGLGFGPIERHDGLGPPADVVAIARRRLAPLVARMRGDHGFEVAR